MHRRQTGGCTPPMGWSYPPLLVGWCGVWKSIGFSFKNKCVSIPCHAMRCHFHMLRAMILFMRALQHLLFFMLSYVLSCKLFHLALIEFICILIGFNMFHEPPRPPPPVGWYGVGNFTELLGTTQTILVASPWAPRGVLLAQATFIERAKPSNSLAF